MLYRERLHMRIIIKTFGQILDFRRSCDFTTAACNVHCEPMLITLIRTAHSWNHTTNERSMLILIRTMDGIIYSKTQHYTPVLTLKPRPMNDLTRRILPPKSTPTQFCHQGNPRQHSV
jgi:hypothetical protein